MHEKGILGIAQNDWDAVEVDHGLVCLNDSDMVDVMYSEMHEQRQGYVADSLRTLGKLTMVDINAFDEGIVETYDFIPYHLQSRTINPTIVDTVIGLIARETIFYDGLPVLNVSWFARRKDNILKEFQKVRTKRLDLGQAQFYKYGSDCVALMFSFGQYLNERGQEE